MKPARFDYVAAQSVGEAIDALAEADDARILAGGQSLVPLMNLRLARPDLIVDVNGVAQLDAVERANGNVQLGALCRHRRLESDEAVLAHAPLIAEAASLVGHVPIRNRATLGGSIAHGDPLAELPAALLALNGQIEVRSRAGSRTISADDLYVGPFMTTIEPHEFVCSIQVPAHTAGDGSSFKEFARRHGDFAIAGVAVALHRDDDGTCTEARMAGCGLGSVSVDLTGAAAALVGEIGLTDDILREIAAGVEAGIDPPSDIHASGDYRQELAQVLAVDAIRTAWVRARTEG